MKFNTSNYEFVTLTKLEAKKLLINHNTDKYEVINDELLHNSWGKKEHNIIFKSSDGKKYRMIVHEHWHTITFYDLIRKPARSIVRCLLVEE